MTRVSFYIVSNQDVHDFACRLLERVYQQAQIAYVHVPNPQASQQFNEKLWTFKEASFLAHDLEQDDSTSPIVLGAGAQLPAQRDVLLNLDMDSATPPDFFSTFERSLEVVAGTEQEKATARQRYAFYRSRGYELETHKIGE
ncbi:MAG: DNA polymerase III subunit chi [Oceanococcus sp.]